MTRHCSLSFALSSGGIGTYVGLYRSGLFNYGSYIASTILNSFAYFWSFDAPNLLPFLLKMFFFFFIYMLHSYGADLL